MKRSDHEKRDVYHAAIDFAALADDIVESLPRCKRHLADQLRRAFTSLKLVREAPYESGRNLLLRIVSMLIGMVRREAGSGTGTGTGTKEETAG